jgi:hypothetical protein
VLAFHSGLVTKTSMALTGSRSFCSRSAIGSAFQTDRRSPDLAALIPKANSTALSSKTLGLGG